MKNKICKKCGGNHIKKDGKMRGKQRYKCCVCGYVFQNTSREHINNKIWNEYTEHKQTYRNYEKNIEKTKEQSEKNLIK